MSAPYRLSLAQKSMFLAVLSAIFLAAMDQTVVATALPTIAVDLHGLAHLPWVITAYLLSSTVSLPIYGKVGESEVVYLSFCKFRAAATGRTVRW
jgi:MFS family permease